MCGWELLKTEVEGMKPKIIFFDVDGTLTSFKNGIILDSTKQAIQQLIKQGIRVVAATGRPLSMCAEIAALGIDTFITANGAYVKHKNKIIHKITMDKKIVKDVMDFASKEGNALTFYSEKLHINGVQNSDVLNALKETLSLTDYPAVSKKAYEFDTYLMCLFANEYMIQKYKEKFPTLTFKRWHPSILNVLENDVSKSLAILKVLEFFNIDKKEAIAFGDGENDIDMIELVGFGIAMGNANGKLKSVADFVTKGSDEDGIMYALDKYGILK